MITNEGFYERGRYFQSSENEPTKKFLETMPREVTLRTRSELLQVFGTSPCGITPFKEVEVVPYKEVELLRTKVFLTEPVHSYPIRTNLFRTPRQYAERMLEAMKKALVEGWDSKKFHIVTLSSGYDTRLIAIALHEVYKERGDSWLGETVFMEADGEYDRAKRILDLIGWKGFEFIKYNGKEVNPHEYHKRSVTEFDAWKRFECPTGFPMNIWWDPIDWMQSHLLAPQDDSKLQCVSGFGSNEYALAFNTFKGLKWYYEWIYYHPLSCFKMKGSWLYPFYNFGFARTLAENRVWRYRGCGVAKHAIKYLAPETWGMGGLGIKDREPTVRLLSRRLVNKAVEDYTRSWYGSKVNPTVRPQSNLMDYSEFWGSWSLASFCDYLIGKGYTVKT